MYKIGFLYPGSAGAGTVPLPTPDWPNNTTLGTATSGSTTAGIQVTWPTSEPTITLRIVSSNVVVSPTTIGNPNFFRIAIGSSSTLGATPFTTYTSSDFNLTVAKNQYVWFRLGPSGASRTITVLNASNNDTLLDTFTLTAGPVITPANIPSISTQRAIFSTPPDVYQYSYGYIQSVQVSGVPTNTQININWSLDIGTQLPKLYYYVNHPEVTTTGNTLISNLNPTYSLSPTNNNTPISAGFTEFIQGSSTITVSSGTFITFVPFYTGSYSSSVNKASGTITSVSTGGIIATITLSFRDI